MIKTYEGSIKLTGNGKYIVKVRLSPMVMVVHDSFNFILKT